MTRTRGIVAQVARRRVLLSAVLAAGTLACGDRRAPDASVREGAYRANNRGVARLERFEYPEAAEAFRQALQVDPSLAMARVNLSLALLYAQDLAGAAREATEAARQLPSAPQPPFILGLVARAENRTADALREFARVRQLDPDDVGANVNLGQMYLEARQYAEATAVLRAAVAVEPYNVSAAYNLGLALTRAGQSDGQVVLLRAQALRSTSYATTYGTGYLEQGHYAEALVSTGAEPELVDVAVPAAGFLGVTPVTTDWALTAEPPSPFGRSFSAADLTPAGEREIAAGLGGGLTLFDADGDGDLDLFVARSSGQRLFLNDGRGGWTDRTAGSGLSEVPPGAVPIGCVAGDYDNDGRTDLVVLRDGGTTLYHNDGDLHFGDATSPAGLSRYPFLPGAAAMVDVDHDGDLDLVIAGLADLAATRTTAGDRRLVFPRDFAPAPVVLLRNNGNGTFTDTTAAAHLQVGTHAIAIVPTDFDNRRDVDLLIVNRDAPPRLFQNLRDGTFRDVAAEVGITTAGGSTEEIAAVAVADVNKDGFPDFFFARSGEGVFALSNGRGRFTTTPGPAGDRAALASQFVDYDNDGLLDLLTWTEDGPHVFRNLGQRWSDVSASALNAGAAPNPARVTSSRDFALGDLNGDGTTDIVTSGVGALAFWANRASATDRRQSLRVTLKGRVSNRLGVGVKVQVRAGSLSARFETSAATPAVAPSDLVIGLGTRAGADTIGVLWPSGILQAETGESGSAPSGPGATAPPPAAAPTPAPATLKSPLLVEELDRKPSSCPFLYVWNGERFEFITDFMGGGEMGYWESPGVRNTPDPLEYVRIPGERLQPKDGRYQVRVTNELEEALFADRMALLAIAHAPAIEVYPNEGMTDHTKPFRLFAVADARVPRATDEHGHDVTDRIARIDRRYPDDFALERFRGFARPHTLSLDLAPLSKAPVLLLTAWTDYAFSSDNLAASQAGLTLTLPALQIKDSAGRWRTAIADIGIPVGRPQTVPVDLSGLLHPGEHEVRIVTNMRIYWDQVRLGTAVQDAHLQMVALDPVTAVIHERGFSAEVRPDGQDPPSYDYGRVSRTSLWKTMPGRYTRLGDVRALLTRTDDQFVIAKPGDEIALAFDAAQAGALPDGWTRTFLLLADGYSKEMDINSASPDRVEPLPFHQMTRYPYPAPEHYPDGEEYQRYQTTYNTRVVTTSVPSIEVLASR